MWPAGAAISGVELLMGLQKLGWQASALCGGTMDGQADHEAGEIAHRGVPMRVVEQAGELRGALEVELAGWRRRGVKGVVVTYGGGEVVRGIMEAARGAGVPSVFWLRNGFYERKDLFKGVAGIVVPSAYLARHYSDTLGLRVEIVFPGVDRERVRCPVRRPNYLTFVSPLAAEELARARPDIPMLVVEGRGSFAVFDETGVGVMQLGSVRRMGRVADPRDFLAVTRALVVPSVWPEPFGRTVVEAMINGVPVVASNRGGLAEAVGIGGVNLPIASRITAGSRMLPTAGEVEPWVREIARLWDDEEHYRLLSRRAVAAAGRFDAETMVRYAEGLLRGWMG